VFTAQYGLSPYIKQTRLVFNELNIRTVVTNEKKRRLKELFPRNENFKILSFPDDQSAVADS
jgi:hypothetical protein